MLGITARTGGKDINVRARKGVYVGTGGNCGNVNFRRTFDPRLTEEYQQACALRASERRRGSDGHGDRRVAGPRHCTSESGAAITKTAHIGCQWGYGQLVIETDSLIFHLVRARPHCGELARRHHGEPPASGSGTSSMGATTHRCRDGVQRRSEQVERRRADLGDLRCRRRGPRKMESQAAQCGPAHSREWCDGEGTGGQHQQSGTRRGRCRELSQETVEQHNSFVTSGVDSDFKKPKPMFKIEKPPFYAAWATDPP